MARRWRGVVLFALGAATASGAIYWHLPAIVGVVGLASCLVGHHLIAQYAHGESPE